MASRIWEPDELAILEQNTKLGFTAAEVMSLLAAAGYRRTPKAVERQREKQGWRAEVQPSKFALDPPLTVQAERALLLFDPHAPFQHAIWLNRVIALALSWGCDTAIVGGDLVDFSSLSYWGRVLGVELDDELEAGAMVVRALERNFRQKALCGGNHERRMIKALKHCVSMQRVLDEFVSDPATVTTNRKWLWLESGGKKFRIVHPKNYSKVPLSVGRMLASKYLCGLICGHGHHNAEGFDSSGRYTVIDAGCCMDRRKVAWLEEEMSTYPEPVLGAVVIIDGVPVLLGQHNIELYEQVRW